MGTSPGFNRENSFRFQGVMPGKEFRVFSSEDVVCDNPQAILVPKVRTEGVQQRCLSAPDRTAYSDGESSFREASRRRDEFPD